MLFRSTLLLLQDHNLFEVHNTSIYTKIFTNDKLLSSAILFYLEFLIKKAKKIKGKNITVKKTNNDFLNSMRMSYPLDS